MGIYQEIDFRIAAMKADNNKNYDLLSRLLMVLRDIIESNKRHLEQITTQLSDYDIHDGTHSSNLTAVPINQGFVGGSLHYIAKNPDEAQVIRIA